MHLHAGRPARSAVDRDQAVFGDVGEMLVVGAQKGALVEQTAAVDADEAAGVVEQVATGAVAVGVEQAGILQQQGAVIGELR